MKQTDRRIRKRLNQSHLAHCICKKNIPPMSGLKHRPSCHVMQHGDGSNLWDMSVPAKRHTSPLSTLHISPLRSEPPSSCPHRSSAKHQHRNGHRRQKQSGTQTLSPCAMHGFVTCLAFARQLQHKLVSTCTMLLHTSCILCAGPLLKLDRLQQNVLAVY